ncbi:MAG: CotH kinase family protein [Crocinitomicaceae bacterium]|nr:CotH kinase family protein [Crocinitomicaceae bacterium]
MKFVLPTILLLFGSLQAHYTNSQNSVVINEMMGENVTTIMDEDGDYSDWLELYNNTSDTFNLEGFFLSDEITNPFKFELPSQELVGDDHILIFLSGKNVLTLNEVHANFKLSTGETILLSDSLGNIIDSVFFDINEEDLSLARESDGSNQWIESVICTPGFENVTEVFPRIYFSHDTGFYDDSLSLSISTNVMGYVHYTLDGSEPTIYSPIYTGPITFYDQSSNENVISNIPSSVIFTPPSDLVDKINVIRCAIFDNTTRITPVYSKSYFIDLNYSMSVVSLMTDHNNLFSIDSGYYVPGANPGSPPWYSSSNFFQSNNESPASFSFIDTNGNVLTQDVGMKLHGGLTRTYSKKSLKIVARSEYGKGEINYPFFGAGKINEFDRIILRNGGQDLTRSMLRDAVIGRFADNLNMISMNSRPIIVFLNGEYWGIHMLRDKIDEHHLENVYGIDKDSIDLLQSNADIIEGDNAEYLDLVNYISNNDLSFQVNFNYIKENIDIESFTDYFITEIYFNNREWPHNNIKFYKERSTEGKWKWILFDMDITAGAWSVTNASNNPYTWMSDTIGYPAWSRILFLKFSENQEFRDYFSNRFADLKNMVFNIDHEQPILDDLVEQLTPEMDQNLNRWGHIPSSQDWMNRVGVFEVFLNSRNDFIWDQTREFFNLGDTTVNVLLNTNFSGAGNIKFSTLTHKNFPWSGKYYKTTTIEVTATENPGYVFSHWLESGDTSKTIFTILNGDTSFTAIYQPITFVTNDLVINEIHSKNRNDFIDSLGMSPDWIEIYNKGTAIIDLNFFYLSDDLDKPCKWRIKLQDSVAKLLSPGEYIVFYADSDTLGREFHTNFSISSEGESIYIHQLFGIDTILTDSIYVPLRIPDVSYGLYPDGTKSYENFAIPTLGGMNKLQVISNDLFINEVAANNDSGFTDNYDEYVDWIEIFNSDTNSTSLSGYFLSDDTLNLSKWKIPILVDSNFLIEGRGFSLFIADDQIEQGINHLPFKLDSESDQVILSYLYAEELIEIDRLILDGQESDISLGRYPDGSENLHFFIINTPNAANFLAVNYPEEYTFQIYPNPTNGGIFLENNFSSNELLRLTTLDGKLVMEYMVTSNVESVDLSKLNSGIYLLNVQSKTYKVLKNN